MRFSPLMAALTVAVLVFAPLRPVVADSPQLSFGIVPQQAASTLLRNWRPLLAQLEQRTGYRFVFRTAPDIPTFEERVRAGAYDFAYMNPYHYTVFHESTGYQALARARDRRIHGIIVVPRDSAMQAIEDVDGMTLAFPAPAAFAASVLPQGFFRQAGIKVTPKYVSSHDSVYRAVARGLFPAGGGVLRTLNAVEPALREQLRILWQTPGYTPHAIAVHPRINDQVRQQVLQALEGISDDESGRKSLQALKIKGFQAAVNSDWDDVRALHLNTPLGQQ